MHSASVSSLESSSKSVKANESESIGLPVILASSKNDWHKGENVNENTVVLLFLIGLIYIYTYITGGKKPSFFPHGCVV